MKPGARWSRAALLHLNSATLVMALVGWFTVFPIVLNGPGKPGYVTIVVLFVVMAIGGTAGYLYTFWLMRRRRARRGQR